jgi:hypothetical protein
MNILKVQANTPFCLIERKKITNIKYVLATGSTNINNSNSLKRNAKDDLLLEEPLITKKQKIIIKSTAQKDNTVEIILNSFNFINSKSLKRKAEVDLCLEEALVIKKKVTTLEFVTQRDNPVGIIWDCMGI